MDIPDRLTRAAENGDAAAVARLLDAGAEADAPNSVRRTALDLAVNAGHVDVVRLLLAAGADPCRRTGEYRELTPMLQAAMRPDPEMIRVLLDAGASMDAQGPMEWVPLVVAATSGDRGHPQTVVLLLDRGADIDAVMKGRTALEYALTTGRTLMARWLLGRGAAPTEYALGLAHSRARQSPEDAKKYAPVLGALHARLSELDG
ncbi:ankyrin repeat domain-containing protein [Streptomyces sp. NPDC015350]|uniref:ankyrin repeat domain-containing protein n=1 Tax=Streptomyces sp. NPDC015350 TaxID=3364955 RepID=UPI0036FC3110